LVNPGLAEVEVPLVDIPQQYEALTRRGFQFVLVDTVRLREMTAKLFVAEWPDSGWEDYLRRD
jgi:hypothetical protein